MFRGHDWSNWIEYSDMDVISELSMRNFGLKTGDISQIIGLNSVQEVRKWSQRE